MPVDLASATTRCTLLLDVCFTEESEKVSARQTSIAHSSNEAKKNELLVSYVYASI